jgi:RecJ-like exonuclease
MAVNKNDLEKRVIKLSNRTDQTDAPDNQRQDTGRSENCDACPECRGLLEIGSTAVGEDVFPDDEFICPACCCGILIEVKEDSD